MLSKLLSKDILSISYNKTRIVDGQMLAVLGCPRLKDSILCILGRALELNALVSSQLRALTAAQHLADSGFHSSRNTWKEMLDPNHHY